jgi:hypothetical protein
MFKGCNPSAFSVKPPLPSVERTRTLQSLALAYRIVIRNRRHNRQPILRGREVRQENTFPQPTFIYTLLLQCVAVHDIACTLTC